jgi:hypothetical protein
MVPHGAGSVPKISRHDLTGGASMASAISGKRSAKSLPLRVSSRTLRPRRRARIRIRRRVR